MNEYKTDMLDLRNIDCMQLLKATPDKAFELAIVDVPYGINLNHNMGRRAGDTPSDYKKVTWDNKPPENDYFNELFRVSKNQIIWGANHFVHLICRPSPCWIVWDKLFSEEVSFASCELAYTSFDSVVKRFKHSSARPDGIHPCQKPVALYRWILANYAKEGDRILDTHLGSMSIAIACHYAGYHLTGTELDADYFRDGVERVKRETQQQTLGI
jgi:site-specific DNA-methyltransferase (adenine-specific)